MRISRWLSPIGINSAALLPRNKVRFGRCCLRIFRCRRCNRRHLLEIASGCGGNGTAILAMTPKGKGSARPLRVSARREKPMAQSWSSTNFAPLPHGDRKAGHRGVFCLPIVALIALESRRAHSKFPHRALPSASRSQLRARYLAGRFLGLRPSVCSYKVCADVVT